MNATRGAVVGVLGPWGSGKTSLVNLTIAVLRSVEDVAGIVQFNPWLFSGVEDLAASLLSELAEQLQSDEKPGQKARRVSADVSTRLAQYSKALRLLSVIPGMGPVLDGVGAGSEAAAKFLSGDTSLRGQRDKAVQALMGVDGRIIVVIDDIDRLNRVEIRDLFRTVRLTASFPNVIYVLCLDRVVVEHALAEEGLSGRDYLEKILTVTCTVPTPAPHRFNGILAEALDAIVNSHGHGPFSEDGWRENVRLIISPLVRTMRDAKRLLASLPITLRVLGEEVNLADVIALEAIRSLAPELHDQLEACAVGLTTPQRQYALVDDAALKGQVSRFIDADSNGGDLARSVVEALFPAGMRHFDPSRSISDTQKWERDRRVANPQVLAYYLSQDMPPGATSAATVATILSALTDANALRAAFAIVPDEDLEDLLRQLENYTDEIDPSVVPNAVEVLLEQMDRLGTIAKDMLNFDPKFALSRVVLQLVRRIPQDGAAHLASELIGRTPSLFAAFDFVTMLGYRENAGSKVVTKEAADRLEAQLRNRVENATLDELAGTRRLLVVLFHTLQPAEGAVDPAIPALEDAEVLTTLLKDAVSPIRSSNGVTEATTYRLNWDILIRLLGGEEAVTRAAEAVRRHADTSGASTDPNLSRALNLVRRYAAGERPDDFEGWDDASLT